MQLCYYRGEVGNFGDELNPFLWKRLFRRGLMQRDDSFALLGIGTICFGEFVAQHGLQSPDVRKIVFGSGVRYMNRPLRVDDNWDIRFYRGPISSFIQEQHAERYITDPAYCLALTEEYTQLRAARRSSRWGIMPHMHSVDVIDWPRLCRDRELDFISPIVAEDAVYQTLQQIAELDFLITESMHGAIVADVLRVPWRRFRFYSYLVEQPEVAELKWTDWLFSMGLQYDHQDCGATYLAYFKKSLPDIIQRAVRTRAVNQALDRLMAESSRFQLSTDAILDAKIAALANAVERLDADYAL